MRTSAADAITYNDIRFRSELRARWAVLFDVLGIDFLCEPQTFRVGSVDYTPAFFLPNIGEDIRECRGTFLDVQFLPPSKAVLDGASAVSSHTKSDCCIFYSGVMTTGRYVMMERSHPCFLSQCPFCGRVGVSVSFQEDGQPVTSGAVHHHACMEEYKTAQKYDILGHFCQDLLITASSPALDIAYGVARSARFDGSMQLRVASARDAVEAVLATRTYCNSAVMETITAKACEWAKEEWMHFDGPPFWVQHRLNAAAGVSPCTCYSCVGSAKSKREAETHDEPEPETEEEQADHAPTPTIH